MGKRDEWYPHAGQACDLGGEHPATVDDHLAGDVAAVGVHGAHPPACRVDARDTRVRLEADPLRTRQVCKCVAQL